MALNMLRCAALALLLGLSLVSPAAAQRAGPVATDQYRTSYVQLGRRDSEALLYEPAAAKSGIALIFSHPSGNSFTDPVAVQMASRGYRVLVVNFRGNDEADDAYLPGISKGVEYLRSLPGVSKVVIVGHSGGGHLVTLYQNVAEHGPAACRGPEKIYPCRLEMVQAIAKADGLLLLDPTLGAFHQMSSIDPAAGSTARDASVDMFAPANGYDLVGKRASYPPAFRRRFHTAQASRNAGLVDAALARVRAIDAGQGQFSDDEPFVIPGIGVTSSGARLYQPDTGLLAHSRKPHLLLRADGSDIREVIHSVRPPTGQKTPGQLRSLEAMGKNTTVRRFLASTAFRTLPGFDITEDDIVGADWRSAFTATPANAEGVTVPTLVLAMSCHYLVVPGEIIFDHLAAADKSYAAVEGATHVFNPCRPEYGDTMKRTFDFVDRWLSKQGRFR